MTIAYDDGAVTVHHGHALDVLRALPDESVHCVVTSPPYFGLRSYGTPPLVWGGDPACEHEFVIEQRILEQGNKRSPVDLDYPRDRSSDKAAPVKTAVESAFCLRCKSWLGSLGLEPTPGLFVKHLIEILQETRQVMRDDAVLFLNLGDTYSSAEYGTIREDEQEGFFALPLEVRNDMFVLWARSRGEAVPWDVRVMLPPLVSETQRVTVEGVRQNLLSSPQEGVSPKDSPPQSDQEAGDDGSFRWSMRLLRRDAPSISLPRSHQGRRAQGIQQERRDGGRLEAGDSGRLTSREIQDSLLELQRRTWTLWAVSTLELAIADIPRQARHLFRLTVRPKSLIGVPWRVAFALQAAGWYLRSDIIVAKPNPMPESIKDRPSSSHEHVFLLTKFATYFYDGEAIKEPCVSGPSDIRKMVEQLDRIGGKTLVAEDPRYKANATTNIGRKRGVGSPAGRNARSVWTINTTPFPGAHFAVMPVELARRCILAGTSERGCCAQCGAPWERVLGEPTLAPGRGSGNKARFVASGGERDRLNTHLGSSIPWQPTAVNTLGWRPTCACYDEDYRQALPRARRRRKRHQREVSGDWWQRARRRPGLDAWPAVPCVVADPFAGALTTAMVAKELGRRALMIELNRDYIALGVKRIPAAVQVGLF